MTGCLIIGQDLVSRNFQPLIRPLFDPTRRDATVSRRPWGVMGGISTCMGMSLRIDALPNRAQGEAARDWLGPRMTA